MRTTTATLEPITRKSSQEPAPARVRWMESLLVLLMLVGAGSKGVSSPILTFAGGQQQKNDPRACSEDQHDCGLITGPAGDDIA